MVIPFCPPRKNIQSRLINDKTIPKFQDLLSSTSWQDVLSENRSDYAYKCFFDKIDTQINSAFPLKSVQTSNRNTPINPWFTPGLLVSRKTKQKLASLKIRKPTLENINKYKYYANTYNYILRKAKHYHYNK